MKLWTRLFDRRQLDAELEEELQSHLAMAVRDRVERGESPAAAERQARREFGNALLTKEVTRQMWGWTSFERLGQDLRYVLRQMRRSPGFTAVALLTLALGLGATTAMFSIVNGVLLEPLPFPAPDRLYLAQSVVKTASRVTGDVPVNARHFDLWRKGCRSCAQVALFNGQGFTLTDGQEPERLPGLTVSFSFFRTLGVQPALGRDFRPEEELPGQDHVVILTDSVWRSHFAANPAIVGRTILVDGERCEVIGVMPATMHLPRGAQWGVLFPYKLSALMFRPLGIDVSRMPGTNNQNFFSLVRLRSGVRAERAAAELNGLIAEFQHQRFYDLTIALVSLQDHIPPTARSALWLLLSAVGAVLLIVCVNLGNLMLVRTTSRYREAGIRIALGASRSQIFGLVLKEALLLVIIGGALGVVVADLGLKLFAAAAPIDLPRIEEVGMDCRVLSFAGVLILLSTLLCGLIPAWRLGRTPPLTSLKTGSLNATESSRGLHLREVLVGIEVALSTLLLISGGLLMLSFFRLVNVDKGFEVEHIITQDVALISPQYRTPAARNRFVDETLRSLSSLPGVRAAAVTNQLPLRGVMWISALLDPDDPTPRAGLQTANFRFISPDFFRAMSIPLERGRAIQETDRDRPIAVISQRAAEYLWPGRDPIGRRVLSGIGRDAPPLTVIGVAGDIRTGSLDQEPPLMVYQPYWGLGLRGASFVVRTQADTAPVVAQIRRAIQSVDPEVALAETKTMRQIQDESVAARRFEMTLAVAFAISALLLASLGIYGVIAFTVARRTPEIGIRIALGASRRELLVMVLGQGMRPVAVGVALGIVGAAGLGHYLASELYGVAPRDPLTFSGVAAVLLTVAIAACWVPARRAAQIDPVVTLRFE